MKTVLDFQPNYISDHPDNVGLYFVTNYQPRWLRVCYKLAQINEVYILRSNFGLTKIKQETPTP